MSWHCEDAAVNYANIPAVSMAWHAIIADLRRKTDAFDDWGMFAYTSASTGVDHLTEIDVGSWEQRLDDAAWAAWVQATRDIAAAAIAHGGSSSACHGSCREGEVDLLPEELGRGFGVMLDVERARPEQHHEPRQVPAGPRPRRDRSWLSTSRTGARRRPPRRTATPSGTPGRRRSA